MRDFPLNAEDLLHMGKGDRGIQGVVTPDPTGRDPPMAFIGCFSITPSYSQRQGLNVAFQGRLVPLDGEDEVGPAFLHKVICDLFLGEERIRRDDLPFDLQLIE